LTKIRSGLRKKRVARPIEKDRPDGYDSLWEHTLHNGLLDGWDHHTQKFPYVVEHMYHADFLKKVGKKTILLEAKGRFWDHAEYSKYIWIKKALPKEYELVFLFANASAPMPQAKRRQDGTRRSHAEWAEANGFRWFTEASLPREWVCQEYRDSEDFKKEYYDENKEVE
jgi:hypothetical protein